MDTMGTGKPDRTEPRLTLWAAMLVGVVSVGSAVAAGQFVAAFVGVPASPFLAVGNAAINLTPGWLKEFATTNFGTSDKTVLLSAMAVVLLGFGLLAGALSRRTAAIGTVFAIVLGLLAMAAVLARTDVGQLAVLAPFVSLIAGVVVFRWLHGKALRWAEAHAETVPEPSTINVADTPVETGSDTSAHAWVEPAQDDRRRFLVTSSLVALGAAVTGVLGQLLAGRHDAEGSRAAIGALTPVSPAPPVPAGADFASQGTPSFITANADFYRIDTALAVPQVTTRDWSLRIHGLVDRELRLGYDDIRNRPLVERTVTLTCVSDPVGGPYISTSNFIGVPLRDLLNEAGVQAKADQLYSTSADGFTVGTPVDVLLDPNRDALLAIGMNRQPLPVEHGFPARMVVPGLYGYVSATKWVIDMELTTFAAKQAYWVPRGYAERAPIKTESRIDVPRNGARVPAGRMVAAGIAWAQTKGIDGVAVRVDGGDWQDAQLATEVSKNTWRMWRAFLDLRPGSHTIECRATDGTGYAQTGQTQDSIPDGATGWPAVTFTVA